MDSLESVLSRQFDALKNNIRSMPLNLGGISAPSGGAGGPAGGFIGKLDQNRITYDMTEAETDYTPLSGYTLVDNLNHIRYRLSDLEASGIGGSGNLDIEEDGILIASGVTIINFEGATVTAIPSGVTVTISGGVGGGIEEAPNDGKQYARKNEAWAEVTASGVATSHATLSNLDYASAGHTGFEPAKGADDNFVTDAQLIVIGNTSGTNSGNVTIADTATIDMHLTGQLVSADVIPSGIKLDDLGTPDNNTDLDASISRHGLLPILPNDSSKYLNGVGSWVTVSGGTGGGIEEAPDDGGAYARKNEAWTVIDSYDVVYSEVITASGTSFSTDYDFLAGTLRVYLNGVRQDPSTYDEVVGLDGFTTDFTVVGTDILAVDYDRVSGAGIANDIVEEAPINGNQYARQDGNWVTISGGTSTGGNFLGYEYEVPVLSGYTWVNQDTATATQYDNYVQVVKPADATNEMHYLKKALPYSSNYMITMGVTSNGRYAYHRWGIALKDSATGQIIGCNFMTSDAIVKACGHRWFTETWWDGGYVEEAMIGYPTWLRLIDNSTNYVFQWSNDGINFQTHWTEAKSNAYLDPANEYGFFVETENGTYGVGICIFHFKIEAI